VQPFFINIFEIIDSFPLVNVLKNLRTFLIIKKYHYEIKGCFAIGLATHCIYNEIHYIYGETHCIYGATHYNSIKTTHFQLLCNSIISTPMMSC